MPLSDHFPEMKGWTPVENAEEAAKPVIPTPEVQSSPYLRTILPLPLQYTGDTIKQYNKPGLSSFRLAPLSPSAVPAANAAVQSIIASTPTAVVDIDSVGLTMPNIFAVSGSPVLGVGTLGVTLVPEPVHTVFAASNTPGLDTVVTNKSVSAPALTITGTPTQAGEWALFIGVGQYPESTQITPGAGWTIIDQVDIQECIASQLLVGTPTVSVTAPMSGSTGFSAILAFFSVATPGTPPSVVQITGVSNLFTAGSFSFPSNVGVGNNILLAIENSDTSQDPNPVTSVSISDSQGNNYFLLGSVTSGAGNTQVWLYGAFGVSAGSLNIFYTLDHRARGGIRALEVSGMGTSGGIPRFRLLDASDIPNLSASKITSGILALARGGTGVDLSATGGTGFVLVQNASHVISARSLIFSDLPIGGVDVQPLTVADYVIPASDAGKLVLADDTATLFTSFSILLPNPIPSPQFYVSVSNAGTTDTFLKVQSGGGISLNGVLGGTLALAPGQGVMVFTDGTSNYWTVNGLLPGGVRVVAGSPSASAQDHGKLFAITAAAAATVTLPAITDVGPRFYIDVQAVGTGGVTIIPNGLDKIDQVSANLVLIQGQGVRLYADPATGWYTQRGMGPGTISGFGTGAAGTTVTTTTLGAGSGPANPQTVVKYLQVNVAGVLYWMPLMQ